MSHQRSWAVRYITGLVPGLGKYIGSCGAHRAEIADTPSGTKGLHSVGFGL